MSHCPKLEIKQTCNWILWSLYPFDVWVIEHVFSLIMYKIDLEVGVP